MAWGRCSSKVRTESKGRPELREVWTYESIYCLSNRLASLCSTFFNASVLGQPAATSFSEEKSVKSSSTSTEYTDPAADPVGKHWEVRMLSSHVCIALLSRRRKRGG